MRKTFAFFLFVIISLSVSTAARLDNEESTTMVVTTNEKDSFTPIDDEEDTVPLKKQSKSKLVTPKIYEMTVESNVTNRFATTVVTSKMRNLNNVSQEIEFALVLPEVAYITGFLMIIGSKQYKAYIKEKQEAKEIYEQAKQSGVAAGHVTASARNSNRFTVSVNVEPTSKTTFQLIYEELLERHNNQYELIVNIHPGQPVKHLSVNVHISEVNRLTFVRTPAVRTGNEVLKSEVDNISADPKSIILIEPTNRTEALVTFQPDIELQKQLAHSLGTTEAEGLAGQFVVQYDVERSMRRDGEVLLRDDGYFVYYFAPGEQIAPLPKHVVFVLDTSGSMYGIRIAQLKDAMNSILNELHANDVFHLVEFSSSVRIWNVDEVAIQTEIGDDPWGMPSTVNDSKKDAQPPLASTITNASVANAKKVLEKLDASGGTDIQSALQTGLKLVASDRQLTVKYQPIVIFLTDGEPTVGETNLETITSTIREINGVKAPIFSLSFGDGADRNFLQKISLLNYGFARHIYEGGDASLQLQQFYKQISSPLLSNVTFKYVKDLEATTNSRFPIVFYGDEIIVAGRIPQPAKDTKIVEPSSVPIVSAWGIKGPVHFRPHVVNKHPQQKQQFDSLERLWAYLTVRQVLEKRNIISENNDDEKANLTQTALDIALKYSFVTAVTSLVVVKPNSTDKMVGTEDASKPASEAHYPQRFSTFAAARPQAVIGSPGAPVLYYQPMLALAYAPPVPAPITPIMMPTVQSYQIAADNTFNLESMIQELPWLTGILNDNKTAISILSQSYEFGENINSIPPNKCTGFVNGTATVGNCKPLHQCPEIFIELKSITNYEHNFCALNKYAGVCCPSSNETLVA